MQKIKCTLGIILLLGHIALLAVSLKYLIHTRDSVYVLPLILALAGTYMMNGYVDSFGGVFRG